MRILASVLALLLFSPLISAPPKTEDTAVTSPGPTWARHVIDDSSRGADGVKLGDINGDGRPDIVTGWEEGGEVRVYLNPGRESVRRMWPRVTVGRVRDAEDAIFADLDADGRLDVVSCTEGKTRTVFWHRFDGPAEALADDRNWHTEPFPATAASQMWMQAATADLDGQYGIDVILASKGKGATIGWLQAPADPRRSADWKYHRLRDAGWIMTLETHDMDGDGDGDVFFTDRKGPRTGMFWLENPGTTANWAYAAWKEHPIGAFGREAMFADVGDIDGDGLVDAVAAVKSADVILCMRGPGDRWEEKILHLDTANLGDAKAAKLADVNGDGFADILFSCENARGPIEGIVWLEQRRDGPWSQHNLGGPDGLKFDLIQTIDIDGDGDLDALTCEERDQLGVIWYENPLGGTP